MTKAKNNKTGKQQPNRAPVNPKGVTDLTEQELERVQGGISQSGGEYGIGSNSSGGGSGKVGQV